MATATITTMQLIGAEKWIDKHYGAQECIFYVGDGFIESRKLTGDRRSFAVRRYSVQDVAPVAQKIAQIVSTTSKKGGRADAILGSYPYAFGYVDSTQADAPDRSITVGGNMGLSWAETESIWKR